MLCYLRVIQKGTKLPIFGEPQHVALLPVYRPSHVYQHQVRSFSTTVHRVRRLQASFKMKRGSFVHMTSEKPSSNDPTTLEGRKRKQRYRGNDSATTSARLLHVPLGAPPSRREFSEFLTQTCSAIRLQARVVTTSPLSATGTKITSIVDSAKRATHRSRTAQWMYRPGGRTGRGRRSQSRDTDQVGVRVSGVNKLRIDCIIDMKVIFVMLSLFRRPQHVVHSTLYSATARPHRPTD